MKRVSFSANPFLSISYEVATAHSIRQGSSLSPTLRMRHWSRSELMIIVCFPDISYSWSAQGHYGRDRVVKLLIHTSEENDPELLYYRV